MDSISRAFRIRAISLAWTALALGGCASITSQPSPPVPPAIMNAADQGNPLAEYEVGHAMFIQATSASSRAKGLAWIQAAAHQNLAMADDFLGYVHLRGEGVPQNTDVALLWIRRAATYGAPAAQLELGRLYEMGNVISTNDARAYFWFSVAAKPVHSSVTILNIDQVRAYATGQLAHLSPALTPTQRAAIDRQVVAWEPKRGPRYNGTIDLSNLGG